MGAERQQDSDAQALTQAVARDHPASPSCDRARGSIAGVRVYPHRSCFRVLLGPGILPRSSHADRRFAIPQGRPVVLEYHQLYFNCGIFHKLLCIGDLVCVYGSNASPVDLSDVTPIPQLPTPAFPCVGGTSRAIRCKLDARKWAACNSSVRMAGTAAWAGLSGWFG